jgi:diketogulonate reductase-like aldo/keto reductase
MAQVTVTLRGAVEMPLLGFGTWQLSGRKAYDATRAALDAGYRHIDTATMYGNEAEIGRAVRDSGVPREDIFITTKVQADRAGRERETIAASLRSLSVAYVDLWLIHWPPRSGAPAMWRNLIAAREAGLTRTIGVSNFSPAQIDQLDETPVLNQIPWSPFDYDEALVAELRKRDVVLEGYSPLKRSDLRNKVLTEIATAHGVTTAQVVLRWHIDHGFVAIPKSSKPERIASNVDIFGFSLSADELNRIDALGRS